MTEGGVFLLDIKMILLASLVVFSIHSASSAAEVPDSPYFPDETTPIVEQAEELEVAFQEKLDMVATIKEKPKVYTVVKGDNLYRIALNHEISLTSLMNWNGLTGDLIHPGDELIVSRDENAVEPVKAQQTKTVAAAAVPKASPPPPPRTVAAPSPEPATASKEMTVTATAYTAYCKGCSGTTAYGIDLRANPNQKVVAVDPRVIPLGTKVWVEGYGEAIAGDTGGAIKGNKIDVFIPSYDNAMAWGVKQVKIRVLN